MFSGFAEICEYNAKLAEVKHEVWKNKAHTDRDIACIKHRIETVCHEMNGKIEDLHSKLDALADYIGVGIDKQEPKEAKFVVKAK